MSRAGRRLEYAAVAVVVLSLLTGCAGASGGQRGRSNPAGVEISGVSDDSAYRGAELPEPYRMPNITLTADNGQPFNLVGDTAHPVTLVFFGYTNCPDECPLVLSELASVYQKLPAAVRAKTQVLFVTTDPARDSDEVLRTYLSRFNPSFVGLRGSLPDIIAAGKAMGVAITGKHRLPGGGYDVGHSSQVIGFRGDRAPVIWTQGTPVRDIVSDILELAGP
jgi:protein SCO1/2